MTAENAHLRSCMLSKDWREHLHDTWYDDTGVLCWSSLAHFTVRTRVNTATQRVLSFGITRSPTRVFQPDQPVTGLSLTNAPLHSQVRDACHNEIEPSRLSSTISHAICCESAHSYFANSAYTAKESRCKALSRCWLNIQTGHNRSRQLPMSSRTCLLWACQSDRMRAHP